MKRIVLFELILLFLSGCAGGSYIANNDTNEFQPNVCANIPIGVEGFQYLDPSLKKKISCADLARCASLYGYGTPLNVPCE
jgi:hypothetical protein